MKALFIIIFSVVASCSFAQKQVTWKGGTPGKESTWNEPKNWSNNKIPDEFSDVIIPDVSSSTLSAPIIKDGLVEVNSITINSAGKLTIKATANLIIYGYTEGLVKNNVFLEGNIFVIGEIEKSDLEKMVKLERKY